MNFSIGNLSGTNANISSMISDLISRKSSSMNSLLEQKSSIENSLAALQNSALGTGSINNSYSSKIASLQDTIDSLKEQYSINSNKLSTINSLNNSYKKTVSTLDDYIDSLKNPNSTDSTLTWTNSNSGVAGVTINSNGAGIQRVELSVTQLATTSVLKSQSLLGGSISKDTKLTDLFAGSYDSAKNSITSLRTDLSKDIKLSELGITSGSFKLGSNTIRVDSSKTLGDLMNDINSISGYSASLTTSYDASGNPVSSFSITGSAGHSVAITNVAQSLSVKGNMTSDTKLAALGIESGVYQVGSKQISIDAQKDSVASLIEKISSAGYNASIINDPDSAGSKKLLITDATGDEVINEVGSNFASITGLTVSEGTFSINGSSFNVSASSSLGSLINEINKRTADGVGAKLENNKLVFVASKTGEVDINVSKGTSNFTNAIGFTIGGLMNTENLILGSDGSYISLTGNKSNVSLSDSVSNGKFTTGNFTISYNKLDSNGVASDQMITTEITVSQSDSVESIIQKIKDQTKQVYTDKNGNSITTSLTAEIVDGKFQIRQTQKGAQYKISVEGGSSSFTEYVGLTQRVDPGIASSGAATSFTGINNVSASTAFSEGNFKINASKANAPSSIESKIIEISQGESLSSVISKINSSGLAITASIKDGKLQLIHNNFGADYSISVEAGSSDFTNKVGFTASVSSGVSNNGSNSILIGNNGGFSLSSSAFSEGSFVLQTNALSADGKSASSELLSSIIEVSSSDSIQSIINKINSATAALNGASVSLGLTASLTADGKIQIAQNHSGEGFDIIVQAGDTDFTQKVGLTSSVSTGVSSSSTVTYLTGSTAFSGTFSGGSFKISTNALDASGKAAQFDTVSVDVNIAQGAKLDSALISSINSQINSIGLSASITSDGKIKFQQLNAGSDFDIKIEAGNTDFTQKLGLTTSVNNIGILSPGRDVNQFTSLTGSASVSASTSVSAGSFKINGINISISSGSISSAINDINSYSVQTGVNAFIKDGKVVLQSNVTGPDTTIYVENGTSSFGETAGFISHSSMGGAATLGQVGSKTTLSGAYDISSDTTVSAGTIKINGYDIVIDEGSLSSAISIINSASDKTGVTASIQNGKFVLTNTTNSTNSISVEAGSSDIAAKTGISAFQSQAGTQELKNATTSALKASKSGLTGSEAITSSSISINGISISFSGNINSAISEINKFSPSTGVMAYLDDNGKFTLENIDTGNKDISISFKSGDFGLTIGAVSYSASSGSTSSTQASSWVKGGVSDLSRSSTFIGGGSLNIGGSSVSLDGLSNLGQVIDKINSSISNVTASIEDGQFTIRKNGVSSLSVNYSGDGDFGRVTGLASYTVGSSSSSNNSYDDGYVTKLEGNTYLSSYDSFNGKINISIDGTSHTVDFGSGSSVSEAIAKIEAIDSRLTAGHENGYFYIQYKKDSSYANLNISQLSGNFGELTGLTGYTVSTIVQHPGTYTTLKGNTYFASNDTVGGTIQITKNGTSKSVSFGSSTSIDDAIDQINALNAGYTASKVYYGSGLYYLEIQSTTTGNDSISVKMTSGDSYDNAFGKVTGFTNYRVYHQDVTPATYTSITGNTVFQLDDMVTGYIEIWDSSNSSRPTGINIAEYQSMQTVINAINQDGLFTAEAIAKDGGYVLKITSKSAGNNNISIDVQNGNFGELTGLASYKVHHETSTPGTYTTLTGNKTLSSSDKIYGGIKVTKNGVTKELSFGSSGYTYSQVKDLINQNKNTLGVEASIVNNKFVLTSTTVGADSISIQSVQSGSNPSFGQVTGLTAYTTYVTTTTPGTYTTITGNKQAYGDYTGSIVINKNGSKTTVNFGSTGINMDDAISKINASGAGVTAEKREYYYNAGTDSNPIYATGFRMIITSSTIGADDISIETVSGNFTTRTGIGRSVSIGSATTSESEDGTTYTMKGSVTGLTRDTLVNIGSGDTKINIQYYGFIDMSGVTTLGEVIDRINAFDPSRGVTASLDSSGRFVFTSTNSNVPLTGGLSFRDTDIGRVTGIECYDYEIGAATVTTGMPAGYTAIYTAQDLNNIRNNLSGKYILMADIDLSSYSNWVAIGDDKEIFSGILDGNGYKISNLTIKTATGSGDTEYSGLFGKTGYGACINNVNLTNVMINTSNGRKYTYSGALVAYADYDTTISNSSSSGTIYAPKLAGGLVGQQCGDSKILQCWSSVSVNVNSTSSSNYSNVAGGLVGHSSGTIENSYASGTIYYSGINGASIGGLVGDTYGATMKNCYSSSSVSGWCSNNTAMKIGGLIGNFYSSEYGSENLYYNASTSNVSNIFGNYSDFESQGSSFYTNGNYFSLSASEVKYSSKFNGFSSDIWQWSNSGPTLKKTSKSPSSTVITGGGVRGLTANSKFNDLGSGTLSLNVTGGSTISINYSSSDSVSDILDRLQQKVTNTLGSSFFTYSFNSKPCNDGSQISTCGYITINVSSDASLSGTEKFLNLTGLSTSGKTYSPNPTYSETTGKTYTVTGAKVQGLTANTVVSGYSNSTVAIGAASGATSFSVSSTDTVADILNRVKASIEAAGNTFEWSINDGQITVTSNASFNFDGPADNPWDWMGLRNGVNISADFTTSTGTEEKSTTTSTDHASNYTEEQGTEASTSGWDETINSDYTTEAGSDRVDSSWYETKYSDFNSTIGTDPYETGGTTDIAADYTTDKHHDYRDEYVITGGRVAGMTSSTAFTGLTSTVVNFNYNGTNYSVSHGASDSVSTILEMIKNKVKSVDSSAKFDWTVSNGQIEIVTEKPLSFSSSGKNSFVNMSGLASSSTTYYSDYTDGGYTGDSTLRGSVTGFTSSTELGSINEGSYTIKQGSSNAYTFNISAGDTIQDVINRINNNSSYTASLDSQGRFVIEADTPDTISFTSNGTGIFDQYVGFNSANISGSTSLNRGKEGNVFATGSILGLETSKSPGGLTTGTFTITQNGTTSINISASDSMQNVIDKINATGKYTAALDNRGRLTIMSKEDSTTSLSFGGSSSLAGIVGLKEQSFSNSSISSTGSYDKYSTLTGTASVNNNMTFSNGNFILSLGSNSQEFNVAEGESISSVLNKINNSSLGISASIQNNRLVFTAKNPGSDQISIKDGTSNFAELTGFIASGNSQVSSAVKGVLSTYTSTNTAMSAQNQGISSGSFFIHLTDNNGNITETKEINILKNETVNSIIEKINNSGLGITASINDSGKMVLTRNSSSVSGGILVTRGSSNFTNLIGFTSGGHQSVSAHTGSYASITSNNSVSSSKRFSQGDFTIRMNGQNAGDYNISVSSSDSIEAIIDKINAKNMGVTASLDSNNKLVLKRDADSGEGNFEIIKGSSDFTNILGFTSGGSQVPFTKEGVTAELVSGSSASSSKRFTDGDFTISLTGQNPSTIKINVSSNDTINDIVNKINSQNAGVTAYINADKKMVITRDADSGTGAIEIKKGSSNFTNEMGFTTGGGALIDDKDGYSASITGSTNINTAEASGYTSGNFFIQMLNKDGSKGDLIKIDITNSGINGAVDSVSNIVNTINSKNAGVTASIVNGKLVISRDQDQSAGSFEIIKGSSDFTNAIGFTTGGIYSGSTTQGLAATQTVISSSGLDNLLVRDSMTLGSIGVKEGSFKINGVDILVKTSDTIYDLAARINSVFSDPKYADSRVIASYESGELVIRTKEASSTARIDIEAGSTNFTEIAKLTQNYKTSSDLGVTDLGQNAIFNINGKNYDMALDLNDISDDGIYNGNNLIYLDKDGNVITDPSQAAITLELKKTGETVIDIGRNLVNDSVSKLQTFVNKFNSALDASENPIMSDDAEFMAFINKIKSALTSNVGNYTKITQQLADIGIVLKVTGGSNSNMGSVHMSLSKTDGKYDYVEAFYKNPSKVMDIILGDFSQPLDYTEAGVFTRLSDTLHTALENNRSGYFKVTPRSLDAQQKAIKKEITSATFDLNELKNTAAGNDSTEGLSEYLKQLEQQYMLINDAINSLNKQYSNSMTKLILNKNNSSFNPIVG